MSKIKTIAIIAIIFVVLCSVISFLGFRINSLQEELNTYDNNFKALNLENSRLQEGIIAYKLDIEQLEYINDSIIEDLNNTRKELKIKDKELLQMQKIKTEITTKDSIFIKDTIFRENFVRLDTLVKDQWHSLAIQLEPTKLSIQAKYTSDLNVFAKSSKEIIGTPKKCFVGRLFQKKYKVIRVDVIDKNPYSVIKESKFVIIE
jgi:anti-anti-sigma regulatory factor